MENFFAKRGCMDGKKIIILGWYYHGNLGDDSFREAFIQMFPDSILEFVDKIPENVNDYDCLIIGGGSFLESEIKNISMVTIPIAFVGVGIEAYVAPKNMEALKKAKIVIARNKWENAIIAPDLAYSLDLGIKSQTTNQITVLMNGYFSPKHNSKEYQLRSWDWFCTELAQSLDKIIEKTNHKIKFASMCVNPDIDDRRAAAYVLDRMYYRSRAEIDYSDHFDFSFISAKAITEIKKSKLVISHRFHGMVFSSMLGVPFVGITGHDKMENFFKEVGSKAVVPYYGFNHEVFKNAIDASYGFDCTDYVNQARTRWLNDLSSTIKNALF